MIKVIAELTFHFQVSLKKTWQVKEIFIAKIHGSSSIYVCCQHHNSLSESKAQKYSFFFFFFFKQATLLGF